MCIKIAHIQRISDNREIVSERYYLIKHLLYNIVLGGPPTEFYVNANI